MSESILTENTASIQESVRAYLDAYFAQLGATSPENVYQVVLELVERPLLEEVMKKAGNNQCRATRYLGLARGTVIKKLKQYELIKPKSRAGMAAMQVPVAEEETETVS